MAKKNKKNEPQVEEQNDVEDMTEMPAEPVAENVTPVKRPRGRPKGVKVGPRPVVWDCAAIVDDTLVHVRLSAPDGSTEEQRGSFSADQAKALFNDTYGIMPESVHGPYYDQKGGQINAAPRKRETVSIPLPTLTMQRENAIFRGWRGVALGIEGREDVVYFMFGEEINPSADKKRVPPPARPVLRTALQFS